jgi:hypothetical protein
MLENFYQLPVMALGAITFAVLFASAYGGFLTGRLSTVNDGKELNRGAVAGIVGVVALLLAFTLGYALDRYQERRQAVVIEANAVMTAFLRADLLPSEERLEFQRTIRAYAATRDMTRVTDIETAVAATLAAQEKLWPQAITLSEGRLAGPERTFLLAAVNEVLDDHLVRAAAASQRIPIAVLVIAVGLAGSAVFLSAFNERSRRFPALTFLVQAFGFSAVVVLILDFDNTADGLIRIDGWIMQSAVVEMDRILDGG